MRKCKDMPFHIGLKLRFYPSYRQKHIVAVNDGAQRFTYNRLVGLNNERYTASKTADIVPANKDRLDYLNSLLRNPDVSLPAALKNTAPFLYEPDVDSSVIDNAIKNYNNAWKKFKDDPSAGVPTFHKKGYEQSYQTNCHYKSGSEGIDDGSIRFTDDSHLILPILGKVRVKGSKKMINRVLGRKDTRIGSVRIFREADGRYYVSLSISSEYPFFEQFPYSDKAVGIDVNISNFLWDSDDHVIANPKYKTKNKQKLAKLQRKMSRRAERAKKENRSLRTASNYQKVRRKTAHLHSHMAGQCDNFRHVVSKRYIESQDIIVVEDLKVKNLLKNHKLAFAISECGWSDFLNKLEYKAKAYGRTFIRVPARNTTQTCSVCGHVLKGDNKLKLDDREWICPECGTYHVRDYNSSKVILARGLATL